jgi:hypothetical protein
VACRPDQRRFPPAGQAEAAVPQVSRGGRASTSPPLGEARGTHRAGTCARPPQAPAVPDEPWTP